MNYAERRGHSADFEVRYHFYAPSEGGRKSGPPFQHYRSDWAYDGDDPAKGIFMIWPEFIGKDGSVLAEDQPVPSSGTATMWIINPDMRAEHRARIHEGVRGYFMEGMRRVAEAVVTRVVGLHGDPDAHSSQSTPQT